MQINDWLRQAERQLSVAGIGTAHLDSLVLLEDVTSKDRAWLLAHPEQQLSSNKLSKLKKLLNRRVRHEPIAYVRGRTEFYGREFLITPAVLEPRSESETMIDLLKKLVINTNEILHSAQDNTIKPPKLKIADVGAGSGALGITAKLELLGATKVSVDLLEIDPKALKVAEINVDKFTLNLGVIESDLLAHSSKYYDVLLCNLPYVPDSHTINQAAMQEPKIAIFGGPDGLDIYRQLFKQVDKLPQKPLYILTECLPPQHKALQTVAESKNYQLQQTNDFIQVFRLSK